MSKGLAVPAHIYVYTSVDFHDFDVTYRGLGGLTGQFAGTRFETKRPPCGRV